MRLSYTKKAIQELLDKAFRIKPIKKGVKLQIDISKYCKQTRNPNPKSCSTNLQLYPPYHDPK